MADNPEQQIMGTISFRQWAPGHVETAINATGLPVGKHAVHVHAFGDMKEGCKSTGPHFRSSIVSIPTILRLAFELFNFFVVVLDWQH